MGVVRRPLGCCASASGGGVRPPLGGGASASGGVVRPPLRGVCVRERPNFGQKSREAITELTRRAAAPPRHTAEPSHHRAEPPRRAAPPHRAAARRAAPSSGAASRGAASRGAAEPRSRGAAEPWSRGAAEPRSRGAAEATKPCAQTQPLTHELRRKTRMNEANLAARTCALNRAAWADTDVHCNARRSHALRALGVHG